MRTYIEALEVSAEEAPAEELDFIRIDLEDLSEAEAIDLVKRLMTPPYTIQRHYCYHDEEPKKACTVVMLEMVTA